MDQNNGLEARKTKEEPVTTLTQGSGENPPLLIRVSLPDQTSYMGRTIRTMEDHTINAQINHSIETMEFDLEMYLSTIRMELGETMEGFLVLHRLQGETSHKIIHTANQEVINLTFLPSADLTTELRVVLPLTNKRSHRAIIRLHLM